LFCFVLVVDEHSAITRLGVSFPLLIASCISSLSRSCPAVASSSTNPPEGGASPTGGRTVFDGGSSAGELHFWMATEPTVPGYAIFLGSCGLEDTSSLFVIWDQLSFPLMGYLSMCFGGRSKLRRRGEFRTSRGSQSLGLC